MLCCVLQSFPKKKNTSRPLSSNLSLLFLYLIRPSAQRGIMGSSNSRIGSPSPSPSPKVNRRKPRKFLSLFCGCSSSHAPVEMEDYPDEYLVNPSALCGDPLFSEVQKPKEELYSISSTDTTRLGSSEIEAANLSVTFDSEGGENVELAGTGDSEVSNHGTHLFESVEVVPQSPLSVCSSCILDRDDDGTISSTPSDERQSSQAVSTDISLDGIALYGIHDLVINGLAETYPEEEDVNSEVEIIENQGGDNRAVISSSGSSTFGASDLSTPLDTTRGVTAAELISVNVFNSEQGLNTEGATDSDTVSFSSSSLSSSATDLASWEARRNGRRSLWDAFPGHSPRAHNDIDTPTAVMSTTDDSDYLGSHERWLFDHTDLFFDDGARADSIYRGSLIQRSNDRRRRRRFEFWDRLRNGLYEQHNWQHTSCPLGLHLDGDECSCNRYLTEESSARSSISRIVILAEALFEVLDEIHRQPMSFSLSTSPVTAPESVVDSFPLKNYEKNSKPESEDSAEQCNICFAEYEEGDKIRVLPCHHEYHMECVDKWLKEVHGVCPLCRGDVREGFAEGSASSSEVTS